MKQDLLENAYEIIESNNDKVSDLIRLLSIISYSKKDDKHFLKSSGKIKSSIKSLMKRFDDTYLLFYETIENKTTFSEQENSLFILFADRIETILNKSEMIKEADIINSVKSKIELGYDRYFDQKDNLVKEFNTTTFEYLITKKNEGLDENTSFIDYLIKLNKEKDNRKNISKEIKKIEKILSHFPQYVYTNKTKHEFEIYNSLFPSQQSNIIKLNKEKVHIENENNIIVAILVIALYE